MFALVCGSAQAGPVPLPRPRPAIEAVPPQAEAEGEVSACQRRIGGVIADIAPQPPLSGPNGCGASDVVMLRAVLLKDGRSVAVRPAATLRCAMAEALALWLREDVAAILYGRAIRALETDASYECRGRNRVPGAKISEHGFANAIDLRGFSLADGRPLALTDSALDRPMRERLKASLCARFSTVLGPGADGHHESHVHVDLIARRSGWRLCQWDMREPDAAIPLPRPRPVAARL